MSNPADKILIEELEIAARIGVPEEERAQPQRLVVSITMWPRVSFHQIADDLSRTVNYAAVASEVQQFAETRRDKLVETFADALARHLLEKFSVERVRVELRKFVLPEAKSVAAICERCA